MVPLDLGSNIRVEVGSTVAKSIKPIVQVRVNTTAE